MNKRVKVFRGDRLKASRDALGLSQEDLAQRLGLAQPQLADYENNKTEPSPVLITRMAQNLGVTTDYLLGVVDNRYQEVKISDLTPDEQEIFSALREGHGYEAIRLIVERQQASGTGDRQAAPSPYDRAQR